MRKLLVLLLLVFTACQVEDSPIDLIEQLQIENEKLEGEVLEETDQSEPEVSSEFDTINLESQTQQTSTESQTLDTSVTQSETITSNQQTFSSSFDVSTNPEDEPLLYNNIYEDLNFSVGNGNGLITHEFVVDNEVCSYHHYKENGLVVKSSNDRYNNPNSSIYLDGSQQGKSFRGHYDRQLYGWHPEFINVSFWVSKHGNVNSITNNPQGNTVMQLRGLEINWNDGESFYGNDIEFDQWVHVYLKTKVVFDSNSRKYNMIFRLYINGDSVSEQDQVMYDVDWRPDNWKYYILNNSLENRAFNGRIDDILFFERNLTENEIQWLANN